MTQRYRYDYYTIDLPEDIFLTDNDQIDWSQRCDYAIDRARDQARL